MRVTIFGTGYVGLVQAAVLADVGYDVVCVDVDPTKVERLKRGEVPIYEPGLERLVQENYAAKRLHFTTDAKHGVDHGDVQFIAVGTPPDEDGSADLKYVLAVADTIAEHMEEHRVVIVKSTVPVGTSDKVRAQLEKRLKTRERKDLTFDVASNPEFLKEGSAVADCTKPDRIIIGVASPETEQVLRELYAPFNRNHEKIIAMDIRSAELTKYAANCMLATKISFMNEIANLADILGADIERVRHGIGSDPRIGYQFIYPGVGYGGSCFPKDVQALIRTADEIKFDATVLKSVEKRNNEQKRFLVDKVMKHFNGDISGKTFAVWGLAFKPNTDDMREAPARVVMEALWKAGAKVRAFDPKAMEECHRIYGDRDDLVLCEEQDDTLEGADALIVITEWKNFQAPDYRDLKAKLKEPVIFDGRNIYDPKVVQRYGMTVYGVGRRSAA
ncbi:UDP-glucose dehydrogenase family protein [Oryzicola mucosus]|uniref:UDP-glucose 6-dehydrogenase n=1 Tax=Oryzicola mucosus TaxID=2767425 RepID=A0A8J6U5D1_9HYPH|nr:UDP-glucose/GDP-mannose dehydrogenase family protein [Oryzicola mucosus]